MKKCSKCEQIKSYDNFHKNKYMKDGYAYDCKDCRRIIGKRYWQENRDFLKIKRAMK